MDILGNLQLNSLFQSFLKPCENFQFSGAIKIHNKMGVVILLNN